MDKIVEDPTYAAYIQTYKGRLRICQRYANCEVVAIPHVIDKTGDGGWIFKKGSALWPIFNFYITRLKERGAFDRLKSSYDDLVGPDQLCTEYDGKPIGIYKSFSLLGIIFIGTGLSILVLV